MNVKPPSRFEGGFSFTIKEAKQGVFVLTGFDPDVIIKTILIRIGVMEMKQVNEVKHTTVIMMTTDALMVDMKLAYLIDDITQDMTHDEIVARLKEIREISSKLYKKLKEIQNNGKVIWKP